MPSLPKYFQKLDEMIFMSENNASSLWTIKYRPKNLNDLIGRESFVNRITEISKSDDVPHMLFAGPSGYGKMTALNY